MLRDAASAQNMKLISEVMDASQIDLVERYADILQVGARNMQNFSLLRELGKSRKPVMLKRGISATIEEWLLSAEYVLNGGNMNVMLCERGIRTFETYTRNTLDISAIPIVKKLSHLPIIVDPSHGTGRRDKVAPMARRGGGRRRRPHHRGPRGSGSRAQRRRPDHVPVTVRPADGRTAHHRAGDWADDLRGAHRTPGMGRLMTDAARLLPLASAGRLPAAEPLFERMAVIGLGLMGGSVAMAARQAWPKALVIGVDRNDVLEDAMRQHAVDLAANDIVVAADAELIVLAAPIEENLKLLEMLPEYHLGEAIVTDLGASKRMMVEAAARLLPSRLSFVGGSPFAGAPRQGIGAARPDMFVGRPWVLTPTEASGDSVERVSRFVRALGATPVLMSAAEHDRVAAVLNQLPQVVAACLMQIAGGGLDATRLALAGKGFIDMTRLSGMPGATAGDTCAANAAEVGAALDELIAALRDVRSRLDDAAAVEALFDAAGALQAQLPSRP